VREGDVAHDKLRVLNIYDSPGGCESTLSVQNSLALAVQFNVCPGGDCQSVARVGGVVAQRCKIDVGNYRHNGQSAVC